MSIQCPRCRSFHVRSKGVAKQIGQRVGGAAGTVTGVAGVMQGASTGASIGIVAVKIVFLDFGGLSRIQFEDCEVC